MLGHDARRALATLGVIVLASVAVAPASAATAGAAGPCVEPPERLGIGTHEPVAFAATAANDAAAVGYDTNTYGAPAAVWITRDRGGHWSRLCADTTALRAGKGQGGMVMLDVAGAPDGTVVAVGLRGSIGNATGNVPQAWRSIDGGATWERVDIPKRLYATGETANPAMQAVAWTGEEFVAAGVDDDPTRLAVWTSADGKRWARLGGSAARALRGVKVREVVGVAVNDAGDVVIAAEYGGYFENRHPEFLVRESNARAWKAADLPTGDLVQSLRPVKLTGIEALGGEFVAVGRGQVNAVGIAITSSDGIAWHATEEWPGTGVFRPLTVAASPDTGFLIVGSRCPDADTTVNCTRELWRRGADGSWAIVGSTPIGPGFSPSALGVALGPPGTYYVGGSVFGGPDNSDAAFEVGTL